MTLPGPNRFKPREPWERDLYLLWLAIALAMIGFGGVFPFLPLYIRSWGSRTRARRRCGAASSAASQGS